MKDTFSENSMNQLEKQEHGKASKTLWHTSWETDGGQITRIHSSVICQTTGPQPLPKRFLHLMRSTASSFK
jgi:hypothetical protein